MIKWFFRRDEAKDDQVIRRFLQLMAIRITL
jgi:hypothetical protein